MTQSGDYSPALFLLGTLEIGGSETKFVRLANRLCRLGMPVHIAYLRPPEALLDKIEGVPTIHLHQEGKWSRTAYRTLKDYVKLCGIKTIVNVNFYPSSYSVPLNSFNSALGLRVITSINTSEFQSVRESRFMNLYKHLLRRCHSLVFGSTQQLADWVIRYRVSAEKSVVVYNGVDGEEFSPLAIGDQRTKVREELGIPADAFVLVCVSQFRPEKGQELLIRAVGQVLRNLGDAPYVILVGDGVERRNVERTVSAQNLDDRVFLVGAVSDVRPFLQSADLFVLPSTAVETFSNAALEAGAMGLPAVISDLGGANEMFPPGSSGIVYERNSVPALTQILLNKYESGAPDDAERRMVREEILSRFDVSRMVAQWSGILWPENVGGARTQ